MQSEEMKKLAEEITLKHGQLKKFRQPYEFTWKEITKYIAPGKNFWKELRDTTPETSEDIYDGTPISAVRTLADGLQGYMARRGHFFALTLEHSKITRRPLTGPVKAYLQYLEEVFNHIFERSNFYEAVNEYFRTGATIGTLVAYIEEEVGEDRLVFSAAHPKQVWIAENAYRKVDTVFREIMMTSREILQRWEKNLEKEMQENLEKTPYEDYRVLHAVFPRTDRDVTKLDGKNKRYASVWLLEKDKVILEHSGFDTFPYIAWRWSIEHGGTYGWAPAHEAINDVYRSNQLNKTLLEAAHESVHPMLNVPQEKMGLIEIKPRGMVPYNESGRTVTPIQTVGSYPVARDREEALELAIKDHFFTDMFLMLNNSMDSRKTATEVMEMQSEKAVILQSVTARIESELFDQIFDRVFALATSAGWIMPPSPEVIEQIGRDPVRIDYVNLLTLLQNRYQEMQLVDYEIQQILRYYELDPSVVDIVDFDEVADYKAAKSSLPPKLLRDKRKRDQIRQQRAQAQQQQIESENLAKQARAVRDMGETNAQNVGQVLGAAGGR